MAVDPEKLETVQPSEPTPYWPTLFFTYEDEIVGALWWDEEPALGHFVTDTGDEPPADLSDEDIVIGDAGTSNGWTLHVLAEGINVDVVGDGRPHEVVRWAHGQVAGRAAAKGITYDESRHGLRWKPMEEA